MQWSQQSRRQRLLSSIPIYDSHLMRSLLERVTHFSRGEEPENMSFVAFSLARNLDTKAHTMDFESQNFADMQKNFTG